MKRTPGFLMWMLLATPAAAQTFNDLRVQPPELAAPQRGSLAGQYARTAFGPADVSRGGFSLASPFTAPSERGPLLASIFPVYSPDGGASEWGQGWGTTLALTRSRVLGNLDYATDELTGPWGRLVRGADGGWYPLGLKDAVRVVQGTDTFVAYLPDGSRWTFGGAARVQNARGTYAWHLTRVESATGRVTKLEWTANVTGRLFLAAVSYGGVGEDFQYRVDFTYEPLALPFMDFRSGARVDLDRRVSRVDVRAKHATTGAFATRWFFTPGYTAEGAGPGFFLTSVQQEFASGERPPAATYTYGSSATALQGAALRPIPRFDSVLWSYSEGVAMPGESSALDSEEDGLVDLESRADFSLIHQGPTGYAFEPLPAAPADARPECRPDPSADNAPRALARMRPGNPTPQVVSLAYNEALAQTELLLCERDGHPVHQAWLPDAWALGASTRLVDLDRDRQPDLLHVFPGGYRVLPNRSTPAAYAFGGVVTGSLELDVEPQATWVQDFNGDSLADLVVRLDSTLFVYPGRGQFGFEPQPWVFPAEFSDGTPVSLAGLELSFVDANKDGLTDVIASSWDGVLLLLNAGTRLVERPVPALAQLGANAGFPVVADFEGTGDTEVFFVRNGLSHSVALDAPGVGLMASADDGRGTRLGFRYGRSPAVPGQATRNAVMTAMEVASSGQEPVTHQYTYATPRMHSAGGFLLGYARVSRQDPRATQQMDFLHEDRFAGVLLASTTRDVDTPALESFESREYDDATFQGIAWKRPRAEVSGWRTLDGTWSTSERTEFLAYTADVCPTRVRHVSAHGTLLTEKTRATPAALANHLHCLAATVVQTGTHAEPALDFRHEARVTFNAAGQVTAVQSVTPGNTLTLQEVTYGTDASVSRTSSPGQGETLFTYEPGRRLLRQVTAPDGVVTRVTQWDPLTDAILSLDLERGPLRHTQSFRHDGQERLQKQWDNLAGSETAPRETYSYRFATATTPASILTSTRVDGQGVRESVAHVTAAGDAVTTARRIPEGWGFDSVVSRGAAGAEVRTWMRPTLGSAVDVRALDYPSLLAGAAQVGFKRTASFGYAASMTSAFHAGVERHMDASLGLVAGQLTRTVLENGTFRTVSTLDARQRPVGWEDEAGTHHAYRYDALGRLRRVELPDGTAHRVTYDGHGRMSLVEREGVARVDYGYDATSGLLSLKRFATPAGVVQRQVAIARDALGRVATETYSGPPGSAQQVYRYWRDGATPDAPTARTALGLLTAVEGEGFVKKLEYRADGRLTRRALQLTGWRTVDTRFTYAMSGDVASESVTLLSSTGSTLSTSSRENRWDGYGRPSEVWLGGQRLAWFGYDGNGQPSTADFTGGGRVTLGYDGLTRSRLSQAQTAAGWSTFTDQRRNTRGLVESEALVAGGRNLRRQYGYSAQGFLDSATDADGTYAYTFDGFGLPRSIQEGGVRRDFVMQGNTLTVGGVAYTFDGLGRTTARGDLSFSYGANGHLSAATRGGQQWQYLYDEGGQRLLKLVAKKPVAAYLEGGTYLDGTGLQEPFRFGGQLVGLLRNGGFQMVATDLRGTVLADTEGTARLASPFGDRAVHPDVAAALDYAQKGYDADLGLIRMGVRDYDARLNRFLTPDPLFLEKPELCVKSPVECNLYGYAKANPVSFVDPTGTCSAPAGLKKGEVGICIETFISTKYVPGTPGLGDNRTFSANDPNLTHRSSTWMRVSTEEVSRNEVKVRVVHKTHAGVSEATEYGPGAQGTAATKTMPVEHDFAKGTTDINYSLSAKNGFAGVAAALPDAVRPKAMEPLKEAIDLNVTLEVSKDGQVSVKSGQHDAYPSYGIYSYSVQPDGSVKATEVYKHSERNLKDLAPPLDIDMKAKVPVAPAK